MKNGYYTEIFQENPNCKVFYKNDKIISVEYTDGNKAWFKDGRVHREDGPAIEYFNGDKFWLKNDKIHREDGPALEYASGKVFWYLDGILLANIKSQEEFERYLNTIVFR